MKIEFMQTDKVHANWLHIEGEKHRVKLFISHETVMAFAGHVAGKSVCIRRDDHKSNTTARSMSVNGVSDWTRVSDEDFERMLDEATDYAVDPTLRVHRALAHDCET